MGEILDAKKTDLELKQFATLSAVKGTQFGKDVYSSVLKFNDLDSFLQIFPDVQRDIVPRKVRSIQRYIQSGLENPTEVNMRFFSAVTVTCKATMYYDEKNMRCAIDTFRSKLSINDGQHRFEAIRQLIIKLEKDFLKSKDKMRQSKIRGMIEELKEMVIPVIIFDDLSDAEEKQLFHDLNNLSQRPSRNANIRLNQTDMFSQMARELATENRYLTHYGVEMDKMSISGNKNENTILLSTIYASSKEMLGLEFRHYDKVLKKENYDEMKAYISETFDKLFYVLPPDINIRNKYLIEKSFAIKAISRFICHARNHLDLQLSDESIFNIISGVDWTYNLSEWKEYGGIQGVDNNILFGGGAGAGLRGVYAKLMSLAEVAKEIEDQAKKQQEEMKKDEKKQKSKTTTK